MPQGHTPDCDSGRHLRFRQSWTEIELFGRQKQAWLATFLDLPHGIPSDDTFGRVFARLDSAQPEVCFTRWVRSLSAALRDQVVLVDGKPSGPAIPSGGLLLHLVSAWADERA